MTLLEGGIKRDFLLPDYETTSELLVSIDSTGSRTHDTLTPEAVAVLPWLPRTTSSVALRLMELDSSICYLLSQKEDSLKEKGYSNLMVSIPFCNFFSGGKISRFCVYILMSQLEFMNLYSDVDLLTFK